MISSYSLNQPKCPNWLRRQIHRPRSSTAPVPFGYAPYGTGEADSREVPYWICGSANGPIIGEAFLAEQAGSLTAKYPAQT